MIDLGDFQAIAIAESCWLDGTATIMLLPESEGSSLFRLQHYCAPWAFHCRNFQPLGLSACAHLASTR